MQKAMFKIDVKTFLWLKKLKILCHGHLLIGMLKVKKLLERFMKKNCKKNISNRVYSWKSIKKKSYMLNEKALIIALTVALKKKKYKWVNIFQN